MHMASAPYRDTFPRPVLIGAAALILLSIAGAGIGRQMPHDDAAGSAITAQLVFRAADRADGAVVVTADGADRPLRVITGQAGFLRGTLRALVRGRRMDGMGAAEPFRLTEYADGRLTLDDPATSDRIELEAFGKDNEKTFARLLAAREDAP